MLPFGLIKQKSRSTLAKNRKSNRLASFLYPLRQWPYAPLFSLKSRGLSKLGRLFDRYLSIKNNTKAKEGCQGNLSFNLLSLCSDERYQPKRFCGKLSPS